MSTTGESGEEVWRQFERLVARIESLLAVDPDVTVRSPDIILGRSGTNRQVDVTVRRRIGSTEALICIECRDRSRPADITWIDELRTKKEDVGASEMLAASASGFSDGAVRAAQAYGIKLRTLSEITDEEILSLGRLLVLKATRHQFRCLRLEADIVQISGQNHGEMRLTRADSGVGHLLEEPLIRERTSGRWFSILSFLWNPFAEPVEMSPSDLPLTLHLQLPGRSRARISQLPRLLADPVDSLPADGEEREFHLRLFFRNPECWSLATTAGEVNPKEIRVYLSVAKSDHEIPQSNAWRYAKAEGHVRDVFENQAEVAGQQIKVLHMRSDESEIL